MSNFRAFFIIVFFSCSGCQLGAQELYRSLYFIGNAANQDPQWVQEFVEDIKMNNQKSTVVFLGDITDENGIRHKPKSKNENRLKAYKRIKRKTKAEVFFLSGDRDWDNSGKQGKSKVRNLESYIEQDLKMKKSFIPSFACPGPYVIEPDKNTVIIAINSQWFMHPHERPEAPDIECSTLYELDFWEELEDILDDAEGKNIIVAAHHSIYSNGPHNGKQLGWKHLIPFYGTMNISFKKNIGTPRELSNKRYRKYIQKMRDLLHDHHSLIYVSGHDFYNQVMEYEGVHYINTSIAKKSTRVEKNENTLYTNRDPRYARLDLFKNGQVNLVMIHPTRNGKEEMTVLKSCQDETLNVISNSLLNPCLEEPVKDEQNMFSHSDELVSVVAGPEYKANNLTKRLMGENFREEWTDTILVPFVNLDTQFGGMRPYARGGGLQTNSLKFKAKDGQRYVFRSVNKNPERALDELTAQTIFRNITKQLISTQHPYGGLVAAHLLDQTDILHATPRLFVMPSHPKLGKYKETFEEVLGMIEIKPKTNKKGKTFGGATAIVASNQMLRSMFKSHFHRIDKMAYGKARVFDMLLGDWDRHEDNWKWAEYKDGKYKTYKPIPRDRDHVFSRWEGFIPRIATKVIPNATNFEYLFNNSWHLNYKASHLDRKLGAELSLEDWYEACRYVQSKMTDEVIESAFDVLPLELTTIHQEEIIAKLKFRRDNLKLVVKSLMDILNKEVDVVGSHMREYFKIDRLDNGNVHVEVFHLSPKGKIKESVFSREYIYDQTKEIYIYALSGKDKIELTGTVEKSIKVRIIPGPKKDEIIDHSLVKDGRKLTQIYQSRNENDEVVSSSETIIKRPFQAAKYDYHRFKLDGLRPIPAFQSNGVNGPGFVMTIRRIRQGFNKPDYAHYYKVKGKYFPRVQAYRLDFKYKFRHFWRDWDFLAKTQFSNAFDNYTFFYGYGNDSSIENELEDQRFYNIDFTTYRFKSGLTKDFYEKSAISLLLNYEYTNVERGSDEANILMENEYTGLQGLSNSQSIDVEFDLSLDFRDNVTSTYVGSLLEVNHRLYYTLTDADLIGGRLDASFSHYETIKLGLPVTLIARFGSISSYGSLPFYNRSILGTHNYLRGFERNRFVGDHAGFLNIEARIKLGTYHNILAPIDFGIFGFNDSGSVWDSFDQFKENRWRQSKGIGVFAAPYNRDFTFSISYALNDEERPFWDIKLGFDLQ